MEIRPFGPAPGAVSPKSSLPHLVQDGFGDDRTRGVAGAEKEHVAIVDEWFGKTILYSESAILTNTFAPFAQLGPGVLRMLGRIHNVPISEADVAELGLPIA